MRAAGLVVAATLADLRARSRPGSRTARARRRRRARHPHRWRDAVLHGLPRVPGRRSAPRSTTRSCTASPVPGCSPRATSSRSTAARSWPAGTATRRSPSRSARSAPRLAELSRGHPTRHVARHRRRPARAARSATSRPPSRPTSGRADPVRDRGGLHRPRDRLGHAPAPGRAEPRPGGQRVRSSCRGMALAIEPMMTAGDPADSRPRRRLDRGDRRRVAGRPTGSTR